jgi:SpoVK/Ycf46/Vps4 family AAA+-type ATPase
MTTTPDPDPMPAWFEEQVAEPFKAGIASVFIVHGDVNCLIGNPDKEDEPDEAYIPIRKFLEKVFAERQLVIFYNIANGAWFLSKKMETLFREVAGLEEANADGGDAVALNKAKLAAKRGLPREPEACFPLLERALRFAEGVAVIIKSAHFIAPATGSGLALPPNERANIERLRTWGQSTQIRAKGNIVLLMTDQAAKVSQELRLPESEIRTVFIPKPAKAERNAFIASVSKLDKGRKLTDLATLAHATQGMSLRQIDELCRQANSLGRPLGLDFVKQKKREMLNSEYGDVMEVLEPSSGLEDIGGHEHIKAYLRGALTAIRNGETRLVPMGVTLMGPPGTGKTKIVEALAKEAGFNFVRIKNIRSMWVGESEARMEKLIYGLRSLAPVVVMNDEADLAEAGRDSFKGDSGVSERIMKMWMELLSDPMIRGQIIVISCTNRPDRMDPALKRSGRSDERILMPMPSATERMAIFPVMFRRHRLPSDLEDFTESAQLTEGLSGADIEKVTLSAFRFAAEAGKKKIDAEALRESILDFIPSASAAEIDSMTVAGLLECSSRRLLPPHLPEIIEGIRLRGLIPGFEDAIALLRDRNILPPSPSAAAASIVGN